VEDCCCDCCWGGAGGAAAGAGGGGWGLVESSVMVAMETDKCFLKEKEIEGTVCVWCGERKGGKGLDLKRRGFLEDWMERKGK